MKQLLGKSLAEKMKASVRPEVKRCGLTYVQGHDDHEYIRWKYRVMDPRGGDVALLRASWNINVRYWRKTNRKK